MNMLLFIVASMRLNKRLGEINPERRWKQEV